VETPWGAGETEHFYQLLPDQILDTMDSLGLKTTGRCLPLNSMENRVYEIEIDNPDAKNVSENFVIAKFYRPGRWTREQILEEHEFLYDLNNIDIPAIAPFKFDGETLFNMKDSTIMYCVFPKRGGRNPDELSKSQIGQVGRLLGRLHYAGAQKKANHRIELSPLTYGQHNLNYFLTTKFVPDLYRESYATLAQQFIDLITPQFAGVKNQRIHGDCHWGNLLFNEQDGFLFIDFDDMVSGPVVQDLWLIMPGRDAEALERRQIFLDAYRDWNDFPESQLKLIEPLRGLRYLHFDSWIARRWEDPAFKQAFPYFLDEHYWAERLGDLRTQISLSQPIVDYY
jgi:Ser/Thr protein kinase RdoA (MazF antagonist)